MLTNRFIFLVIVGLCIPPSLLAQSAVETNLVANPSMEIGETLPSDWTAPLGGVSKSMASNSILHGSASLEISETPSSKHALQIVKGLTASKRYIVSVNVQTGSSGTASLSVVGGNELGRKEVEGGPALAWQKIELEFVADSSQATIHLSATNTSGSTYFDLVKLVDASSLIGEGGFENDVENWKLGEQASITDKNPFGGQKCLQLTNGPSQTSSSSKYITLPDGFDDVQFKLCAKIRLERHASNESDTQSDSRPNAKPLQLRQWLSESNNRSIPDILKPGVGFFIRCYSSDGIAIKQIAPEPDESTTKEGVPARINPPLLAGRGGFYQQFEHHFLVPKGTVGLRVVATNTLENTDACFDNIRLTWSKVPIAKVTDALGPNENPVEGPLAGSFVSVNPSDFCDLQKQIDNVTDPIHANFGKEVWVPKGVYKGHKLELKSQLVLKMHPQAILSRSSNPFIQKIHDCTVTTAPKGSRVANGFMSGFLSGPQNLAPVTDIHIEGGTYRSNGYGGAAYSPVGCRFVIRNHTVPSWTRESVEEIVEGRKLVHFVVSAFHMFGNDFSVHNNSISGPASDNPKNFKHRGLAGIQFWGVSRASVLGNQVYAGDDALGIFPLTRKKNNLLFDYSNNDVEAYNNQLDSHGARAFACGLAIPRQTEFRLSADVKNIRCRNFTGKCGGGIDMITIMCVPAKNFTNTGNGVVWDMVELDESTSPGLVKNIVIERGRVEADLSIPSQLSLPAHEPKSKLKGIAILTRDVGRILELKIRDVHVKRMLHYPLFVEKLGRWEKKQLELQDPPRNLPFQHNEGIEVSNCLLDSSMTQTPFDKKRAVNGYKLLIQRDSDDEVILTDNDFNDPDGIKLGEFH